MSNRWFIQWYLVRGFLLSIALNIQTEPAFAQSLGVSIGYRAMQLVDEGPHVSFLYDIGKWNVALGSTYSPNYRIDPEGNQIYYSTNFLQHFSLTLDLHHRVYKRNNHQIYIGIANGIAYRHFWWHDYFPYTYFTNAPPYIDGGYLFLDELSQVSKNVRFSHHILQLKNTYRLSNRMNLAQSVGLGIVGTSALEYNLIDGGWVAAVLNFTVALNHYFSEMEQDISNLQEDVNPYNAFSLSYSDGIISNGFSVQYSDWSRSISFDIGLIVNAPIRRYAKYNRVYHQRGKVRRLTDFLGLKVGVSMPFQMLSFTAFPFYSLEVKRQRLSTSWFKDTGLRVPEQDQWLVAKDDRIYAYYNYISESPAISFENFVGLGARFDLSDKVFIEERLGVGLGFYIHEFEDYYPGPKKHHEFVFPYFSLGLGYKL